MVSKDIGGIQKVGAHFFRWQPHMQTRVRMFSEKGQFIHICEEWWSVPLGPTSMATSSRNLPRTFLNKLQLSNILSSKANPIPFQTLS